MGKRLHRLAAIMPVAAGSLKRGRRDDGFRLA
jgi:hypothetical protein